jgi:hypothetical protein
MPPHEKEASPPEGVAGGGGASGPDSGAGGGGGERTPWLSRFGGTVGAGAFGAVIAAVPATLRVESVAGVCRPGGTWALLGGMAIVPMSIAILVLRRARVGFVALGKRDSAALASIVLLWLVSTFASLSLLGSILRARTHHRALGGVVFAGGALSIAAMLALVCARAARIARGLPRTARWGLGAIGGALLGVVIALARAKLAQLSSPPFPFAESAKLVDGMAFALSALLASVSPLVHRRFLALLGPPLAVAILVLGVSSLSACPPLRDAIEEQAPVFFWLVALVAPH